MPSASVARAVKVNAGSRRINRSACRRSCAVAPNIWTNREERLPVAWAWVVRLIIAASLDRAWGRHTWTGNRHRWPRGAVRSAKARSYRSGIARTQRRVWTATPWRGRARCRPRPPTHEKTCLEWRPIGRLPFPSGTSRPRHEAVASDTPESASHSSQRSRSRLLPRPLQLGGEHGADLDRGWPRPERRHRRPPRPHGRRHLTRQAPLEATTSSCRRRQWQQGWPIGYDELRFVLARCGTCR